MEILGLIDLPGWLLTILLILLTLYLYTAWCQSLFSRLGIPGPRPIPFLGVNASYAKKGIVGTDIEITRKYGRVVGIYQGNMPTLIVTDPDIIKHFTVKDFGNFHSRFMAFPPSKLFNGAVSVVGGEQWKFIRSTLSPTFSSGKMRNMVPLVQKCIDNLIENIKSKSEGGKTIDMKEIFSGFTMDVIATTAFGIEVDSQKNQDDPFVRNARKAMTFSFNKPIILIQVVFPFLKHILKFVNVSPMEPGVLEFFEEVTNKAIEERKKDTAVSLCASLGLSTKKASAYLVKAGKWSTFFGPFRLFKRYGYISKKRNDFLQLMLSAHKERNIEQETNGEFNQDIPTRGLTNEEIMGNALVFYLAGYDTSANTLSFASYCLATNPDWQDKLIDEIENELGSEKTDYDNVSKLNYLDMFVSEVLRMYNPASRFNRQSEADVYIKGVHIPKGIDVSVSVHALHMDPEFWPEPEKFDPLRFTKENKAKRNPYTYLPFGSGPRNCIGIRLAQLEIKMALVSLLRVLKFVTTSETEIPPVFEKGVLVRAQNGIKLKVEFRS